MNATNGSPTCILGHHCACRRQTSGRCKAINNYSIDYKIGLEFPIKSPFRAFQVFIRISEYITENAEMPRHFDIYGTILIQEDNYRLQRSTLVHRSYICKMHRGYKESIIWKTFSCHEGIGWMSIFVRFKYSVPSQVIKNVLKLFLFQSVHWLIEWYGWEDTLFPFLKWQTFHGWRSHELKLLANGLMSDPKVVI